MSFDRGAYSRIPWCVIVFLVILGATGCGNEITGPRAGGETLALAAAGDFTAWALALNIESTSPGADASFNTSDALDGCPFTSRDGKSFYMASNRTGSLINPATGSTSIDIWVSTRASTNDPWGEPVNVGPPINSTADDFCPTIARDGHTFYFVSRRQEGIAGQDYCGEADIYVTRLRNKGGFEEPQNLGCTVNSSANDFSPFPLPQSTTGPVLYFSSTRPGLGSGGDLYMTESHGGVFSSAELVPGVNSDVDDGHPNVRRDGLEIFFYSARTDLPDAQGGNDIYAATRASTSDPWSTPVNLGPNVNSFASETRPSLAWDGTILYFGTTREGSSDIYVTTREKLHGGS
jgi:hypothetical protein